LNERVKEEKGSSKASWLVIKRLLGRLKRFGIFDTTEDVLDAKALIKAGKVSILDLSNSYTVQVNNIVIAYLLRKIFDQKIKDENLRQQLLFIEEAHTYVSRENAGKMEALMDRLREVTRREEKRWLGLCFISQQPSHLPDEIFELSNTKIIHQTTGQEILCTKSIAEMLMRPSGTMCDSWTGKKYNNFTTISAPNNDHYRGFVKQTGSILIK
jgi:DNA helicase HerA-like ATPase